MSSSIFIQIGARSAIRQLTAIQQLSFITSVNMLVVLNALSFSFDLSCGVGDELLPQALLLPAKEQGR